MNKPFSWEEREVQDFLLKYNCKTMELLTGKRRRKSVIRALAQYLHDGTRFETAQELLATETLRYIDRKEERTVVLKIKFKHTLGICH